MKTRYFLAIVAVSSILGALSTMGVLYLIERF